MLISKLCQNKNTQLSKIPGQPKYLVSPHFFWEKKIPSIFLIFSCSLLLTTLIAAKIDSLLEFCNTFSKKLGKFFEKENFQILEKSCSSRMLLQGSSHAQARTIQKKSAQFFEISIYKQSSWKKETDQKQCIKRSCILFIQSK